VYVYNREFEKNASGLLNELYKIDQVKSHKLLRRPLQTWNGSTAFKLADDTGLMEFMKHDCCQTKLDGIWRGNLTKRPAWWQVGLNFTYFITFIVVHKTIKVIKYKKVIKYLFIHCVSKKPDP